MDLSSAPSLYSAPSACTKILLAWKMASLFANQEFYNMPFSSISISNWKYYVGTSGHTVNHPGEEKKVAGGERPLA